jgi:hypothetical protein
MSEGLTVQLKQWGKKGAARRAAARRAWLVLALAAPFLSFAPPVRAQGSEPAAAEALFRSAQEAGENGDWQTACDRFEESQRLEPAPGTILNIARCREKLGQIASAWKRYGEAAQKLPEGDKRLTLARKKEAELAPQVPRLRVVPPPGDEVIEVTVGTMKVAPAMFGVDLPFDPGTIKVVVRAEGRADAEQEIVLKAGETSSVELALGAPLEKAPETGAVSTGPKATPEKPQEPPSGAQKTWGFVSLGVGVAGFGVGVAGLIWAGNENATVVAECDDDGCSRVGFDAAQRGKSAQALELAGFIVGAAATSLGVILLVTAPGDVPLQVEASVLPGGSLLSVKGAL